MLEETPHVVVSSGQDEFDEVLMPAIEKPDPRRLGAVVASNRYGSSFVFGLYSGIIRVEVKENDDGEAETKKVGFWHR